MIDTLAKVFGLKDMGKLAYFLGLQVEYKSNGDIFVNHAEYVKDFIHKAGMDDSKPCSKPCKPNNQVLNTEGILLLDPTQYQSLVRALQYLTFTRPDIAFAVNTVCKYMNSPTYVHFGMVKRILQFLQRTLNCGLTHASGTSMTMNVFSDSNWAADLNTRRSIAGYVVYLGTILSLGNPRSELLFQGATEAEYQALAHTVADIA
ncbi:uncharacterized mitochondrial protein AtMg00810-like [Pyrus x bretschneideri]|uniref:uncharacterized mitochondrial protein AtMg00810-like n=1 Tax=Pyrus x bretschneideri TaxID=225117 RepID=UPI00202FDD1F|nr:uncharacterized mitochondrial protein AtMg00810-like [Pyrus x bretschneideri]